MSGTTFHYMIDKLNELGTEMLSNANTGARLNAGAVNTSALHPAEYVVDFTNTMTMKFAQDIAKAPTFAFNNASKAPSFENTPDTIPAPEFKPNEPGIG